MTNPQVITPNQIANIDKISDHMSSLESQFVKLENLSALLYSLSGGQDGIEPRAIGVLSDFTHELHENVRAEWRAAHVLLMQVWNSVH